MDANKVEVGKIYLRISDQHPTIRKVLEIRDGTVTYEVVYGPNRFMRVKTRSQKLHNFIKGVRTEIPAEASFEDYGDKYGGKYIGKNYTLLSTTGEPLARTYERKAKHWLKKGYAVQIDEETIQFTVGFIEEKLKTFRGNTIDNPFWLVDKNKCCAVCGTTKRLTSHHVVPARHLKKVPRDIRDNISNRLFICFGCHKRYEKMFWTTGTLQEPDFDVADPHAWEKHFIDIMQPKYLPEGWSIILK